MWKCCTKICRSRAQAGAFEGMEFRSSTNDFAVIREFRRLLPYLHCPSISQQIVWYFDILVFLYAPASIVVAVPECAVFWSSGLFLAFRE